jgi:hypothetical protein
MEKQSDHESTKIGKHEKGQGVCFRDEFLGFHSVFCILTRRLDMSKVLLKSGRCGDIKRFQADAIWIEEGLIRRGFLKDMDEKHQTYGSTAQGPPWHPGPLIPPFIGSRGFTPRQSRSTSSKAKCTRR